MERFGALRIVLILSLATSVLCQENAGTNISPSLEECYNNTLVVTRDLRLPATMETLIEVIRKAEDGNPSINPRELSVQLLNRFRQDGIWKNDRVLDTTIGLPYSPRRWEAYKNIVQLKKLTPGNALTFNNNSLTLIERCSLHSMLSNTIELNERGDEGVVCNRVSRYTSRIQKREKELTERVDSFSKTRSSCPIESGVVFSKWGTVKAGQVLAGIASGFQAFQVPTSNGKNIDNRYGSTIAGDLSEAALYQASSTIKIGSKGGWNSTTVPKYYFLQDQERLQVTDAEIRGGLDGLYLALNMDTLKSRANNVKISQILDMYYSPRGVLNNTLRACNRKLMQTAQASSDKLVAEVTGFNYLLDGEATYDYSPKRDNFPSQAENAVRSFNDYIATLNDVECSAEDTTYQRVATDLIIFIDTTWDYKTLQSFLAYVLQNSDVNKYDSRYTVLDGVNCDVIVNKTMYTLDFHELYNLTEHQRRPTGFDYNKVLQVAENLVKARLDNQTEIAGQSSIVLLVPHNTPNENQKDYAETRRREIYKRYLPDMRVLVAATGSKEAYASLVSSANNDVILVNDNSDDNAVKDSATALVDRMKQIPRNVVNPSCTSSFKTSNSNTFEVTQYVEPQGVNYHRISPQYFYSGNDDNRNLKIRGQGLGTLTVCMSRTEANPSNSTENCKVINSDEVSYSIKNFCNDESVTSCHPIYLSVQGTTSNVRCTETQCRFPDSIKYIISLENVGCSGASSIFVANFSLAVLILLAFSAFC